MDIYLSRFPLETGFYYIAQAALELLGSSHPPTPTSQVAGTTGTTVSSVAFINCFPVLAENQAVLFTGTMSRGQSQRPPQVQGRFPCTRIPREPRAGQVRCRPRLNIGSLITLRLTEATPGLRCIPRESERSFEFLNYSTWDLDGACESYNTHRPWASHRVSSRHQNPRMFQCLL